jgi:hypothetical protein
MLAIIGIAIIGITIIGIAIIGIAIIGIAIIIGGIITGITIITTIGTIGTGIITDTIIGRTSAPGNQPWTWRDLQGLATIAGRLPRPVARTAFDRTPAEWAQR